MFYVQEVALSVASLVEKLDIPEENIATLLCYLEDYSPPLVNVTNHVYSQVMLSSLSCSSSHWLLPSCSSSHWLCPGPGPVLRRAPATEADRL